MTSDPDNILNSLRPKPFQLKSSKYGEWEIGSDNYYASGSAQSYFGEGWFTDTHLARSGNFGGIPVKLGGNMVMRGQTIDKRLSALTIDVDYERVLEQYQNRAEQIANKQAWEQMDEGVKKKLQDRVDAEKMLKQVKNEAFQKGKNMVSEKIDSLKSVPLLSPKDSIRLDSLEKLKVKIRTVETKADSTYQHCIREAAEIQDMVAKWQSKAEEARTVLEDKALNGDWDQSVWEALPGKEKKLKYLRILTELKAGSYRLSGSNLDISSIPLNGIKVGAYKHGYYGEISYGRESAQSKQTPLYARNFKLNGVGRTVMNIRVGAGKPTGNHTHLIYSDIKLPSPKASGDTLRTRLPIRNILLTFDMQYQLGKHFFTSLTTSASGSDFTGTDNGSALLAALFQPEKQWSNKAILGKAGWQSKSQKTVVAIGYQSTGNQFITLGNLFLLNNRNGVRVEFKQKLFKQKLTIKSVYIIARSPEKEGISTAVKQNQYSGEISWKIDRRGSRAWFQYAPSFYADQGAGTETATYQINLATMGVQIVYPKRKNGQWLSMFQVMNYNDQSQFGDTSTITGLGYGMFSHSYTGKKYSMTTLINAGVDQAHLDAIKDLNADCIQTIQIGKKFQLIQGVNFVKRYYDPGLYGGGTLGLQYSFNKLALGVRGTILSHLNGNNKQQVFLNTTATCRF